MSGGWKTKKLGDVCDLLNRGISPKYLEKGGICVLNQKCIRNHQINYTPSRRHDLSEKKVTEGRFIKLGDVLVNSTGTGTLGRVAQVRQEPIEPTTVDSHVTIVRPKTAMFHLDFFGYMLVVIEDAIKEAGEGCGGQTELARSVLAEKFFVSFPEQLCDQKRIVDILDETFEGITTAKSNVEKSLHNARDLFNNHLNAIFTQQIHGWEMKYLGDVCSFLNRGVSPKYLENGGIVVLNQRCIRDHRVCFSEARRHDANAKKISNERLVRQGDVLVNSTGTGTLGRVAQLIENPLEPTTVDSHVTIVRPIPGQFCMEFFGYMLISIENAIKKAGEGCGGQTELARTVLAEKFLVSYPKSLLKQEAIVIQLNSLFFETRRLESIYQRKLIALDELKKSVLHRAFNGNLKGSP
ncbi:MAG: restriction endonuclease subunit S [Parachlamydiaceae bacterium]